MTRLSDKMVKGIDLELERYDSELRRKTGHSLKQIACYGACFRETECSSEYKPSAAVVPISSGQGTIEGFVEAVHGIIDYLGFLSFVTDKSDVSGIAQAIENGSDIVFLADDDCFIAVNLDSRYVVYNTVATARGYVAALNYLAGGLEKKEVLVIGAGKIGNAAAETLKAMGAAIAIYDIDQSKTRITANRYGAKVEKDLEKALHRHTLILDASPASNIIRAEHIKPETTIASCGIPIGLTSEACSLAEERLVHDPLQIGVATMMMMVFFTL